MRRTIDIESIELGASNLTPEQIKGAALCCASHIEQRADLVEVLQALGLIPYREAEQ